MNKIFDPASDLAFESTFDMHRKYSLFAHGSKKALNDEEKAEQGA